MPRRVRRRSTAPRVRTMRARPPPKRARRRTRGARGTSGRSRTRASATPIAEALRSGRLRRRAAQVRPVESAWKRGHRSRHDGGKRGDRQRPLARRRAHANVGEWLDQLEQLARRDRPDALLPMDGHSFGGLHAGAHHPGDRPIGVGHRPIDRRCRDEHGQLRGAPDRGRHRHGVDFSRRSKRAGSCPLACIVQPPRPCTLS